MTRDDHNTALTLRALMGGKPGGRITHARVRARAVQIFGSMLKPDPNAWIVAHLEGFIRHGWVERERGLRGGDAYQLTEAGAEWISATLA